MNKKKIFYNEEKEISEAYTEKWLLEKCTVKDIDNLIVNHHYWEDPEGELWVDFNNPMENVYADFNAYREVKNFMKPSELKKLRETLNLTVREFSKLTGLGYSNISQIENNQRIQTKYQDLIFKLIQEKFIYTGKLPLEEIPNELTDKINHKINKNDYSQSKTIENKHNLKSDSYNFDKILGDAI
ncbi:helix-turn-helix domain-containing protein [Companilactobacillus suantsaicola]|uniref:Helix-turn-helix domain-containing protein n=1 Tax=Companilactobacillus suantsaicola TaxID=2487723 RepID=A0A4Z0JKN3_9LACO|nr:helix-turn-helix domain-containing protein [Companilactobacillus suantsaicola]TGD22554.1 helix-turn-helix domain-containing protein [Companilactobacillus suantsaicola]